MSHSYEGNDVTNQRMELNACILGVEKCLEIIKNNKQITDIHIYTDSMYVINCITKWANSWCKLDWKRRVGGKIKDDLCNLDLIKTLYKYNQDHKIKFHHVRSHQKQPNEQSDKWYTWYGNHMADKLATDAMNLVKHK